MTQLAERTDLTVWSFGAGIDRSSWSALDRTDLR
jgi:hypothetical protein